MAGLDHARGTVSIVRCIVVVAAVTLATPARADPPACVIRGEHVSVLDLEVRAGSATFTATISNVPVVATSSPGKPIDLAVAGVIAFHGTAHRIWYTLTAPTVVADGMVTLVPGSHVVSDRDDGADVIGDGVVYAEDVLPGEDKAPDEQVGSIRVPCSRLSLDWQSYDEAPRVTGDGTQWRAIADKTKLVIHSAASAGSSSVVYAALSCGGECFALTGITHRSGWRQVSASNEGVTVTGWVPDTELRAIPGDVMLGYAYGCSGHHGHGMVVRPGSPPPRSARIRIGTTIYAEPGRSPWASVLANATFEVRVQPGQPWVEVTGIPGVSGAFVRAFVPLSTVTFLP